MSKTEPALTVSPALVDNVPPNSAEAEQAVLGAVLSDPKALAELADMLKPEDFYRDAHRVVFRAMLDLFDAGEVIDMITLVETLKKGNRLDSAGGITYVTTLANCVPTAANAAAHAKIVREKAAKRKLINMAAQVVQMGFEDEEDVSVIVERTGTMLIDVSSEHQPTAFAEPKSLAAKVLDRFAQFAEAKGRIFGLATGFPDFDRVTGGLQVPDFILLAARPSMGKTALAVNMAVYVAMSKRNVALFSLEMSKEQLMQRIICGEAELPYEKVKGGIMNEDDWKRAIGAANEVAAVPLHIDDTGALSVSEVKGRCRRLKAEKGLDLVVIDYLQLMRGDSGNSGDNRQQEISEISRGLKALAKDLSVPVIALSQLSREVEKRANKRPMLSDLRESGSLEQDADIVGFLYRDDYYNPETENKNITELILAKHRNGPTGTIELYFRKDFTRFYPLSRSF